jgi:glycine hydroxymethyltransferase
MAALWADGLERFGGPFLGGQPFTAVDAMFAPVAWLTGVEWADARQAGLLLGTKLTQTEFKAFIDLGALPGGTDVHLVLVDLRHSELDGQQAEDRLHEVGITVNRNAVPNDPRPPMVTSGLRIGTPALATRGFAADDFREVADVIAEALKPSYETDKLKARVTALADKHPLYPGL